MTFRPATTVPRGRRRLGLLGRKNALDEGDIADWRTRPIDNLQGERTYGFGAYPNAKLATILFTMELARRVEGTGVTVHALHPGFTATGFGQNNGKVMAALVSIVAPLVARSPAKGAETSIYLASSPSVEGMTGKYFYNSHVTRAAPQATDMAVARKLWEVSAELVHRQAGRSAISASDDKR